MTSMLLSGGMGWEAGARRPAPRALLLPGLLDVLGHHVLIRGEPVRDLLELATLHLPDLHEPATLVILRGDLQRRHEPAQREVVDLLEALLRVLAGDLAIRLGLHRVADRLDVKRGHENATVVEHRG